MAELFPDRAGDIPEYRERLVSTRVADDGKTVTITKLTDAKAAVDAVDPKEALSSGVYTKTTSEAVSDLLVTKITEERPIPGNTLYSKRFNRFGGLDVTGKTDVAATTTPTNVTYSVQSLEQQNSVTAKLIETIIATGSVIDVIEQVDREIPGSRAVIEYTLHLASETLTADSALVTYEKLEFPDNPLMRIWKKTTYSIPPYTALAPLIEYEDRAFAFPQLFVAMAIDHELGTTRRQRPGFSTIVPHRIETYFGTTPVEVTPYQLLENDYVIFSAQFSGLMDAGDVVKTLSGGGTATDSYLDSSPTLTTYVGLIGSHILVGGSSTIWQAGIFKTQKIYVKLQ